MAEKITAQMVKALREQTGAGMMECKKVLTEAEGDIKKAEMLLVSRGQKKAKKSAARTAAEGIIAIQSNENATATVMAEINCETDFAAKDKNLVNFSKQITQLALDKELDNVEALNEQTINGETVNTVRESLVAKIGENVQIRRLIRETTESGQVVGSYVHQQRIGVAVTLLGGDTALAKDLAMHIAALNPKYFRHEDMPKDEIEKQKAVFLEKEEASGKPESIIEKIVEGKIKKIMNEECLVGQPFFKDPDQTVAALLKSNKAEIVRYTRFEVGEGIDVKKLSFADEVAEQARGSNA
jgi:elongation factor Ts